MFKKCVLVICSSFLSIVSIVKTKYRFFNTKSVFFLLWKFVTWLVATTCWTSTSSSLLRRLKSVNLREREREREIVCVCVFDREREWERDSVCDCACVCLTEREWERERFAKRSLGKWWVINYYYNWTRFLRAMLSLSSDFVRTV